MSKTLLLPILLLALLHAGPSLAQQNGKQNPSRISPYVLFDQIPIPGRGFVSIHLDREESPQSVRLTFTGASETIESIQEISLQQRGLNVMLEGAFLWNGQLALITSLFYPGPQRDLLFIHRYSLPDFEELSAAQVAEAYVPGRLRIPFGYSLSPDSSRIMFYSWTYAVPEDPVKMGIHVLDQDLKQLWSKRFLLPNKNENFYIYACQVDNAGHAYLLCEDYKGKVSAGSQIRDEKIERFVLRLAENSSEATSFAITLDDRVITDLRFTLTPTGDLLGAGFYREGNKPNQTGAFVYRIDQKTQGYRKWEFPISKEDYWQMHPYAEPGDGFISGTRQFRDFFVDQLVWDDQQGLTLVAEQRIYDNDEDKYNDILLMQLDTNWRKQWAVRVPKQQAALWTETQFISYRFLRREGKNYVLFNDAPENIPTEKEPTPRIKDLSFVFNNPKVSYHLVQITDQGHLLHQDLGQALGLQNSGGLVPSMVRSDGRNVFLLYFKGIGNPIDPGRPYPISWITKN